MKVTQDTWPDFVDTMDFGGFKMLTQEEVNNWDANYDEAVSDQERLFIINKKNIKNVLKCLEATSHWLQETGEYESQILDEVHERIEESITDVINLLEEKIV